MATIVPELHIHSRVGIGIGHAKAILIGEHAVVHGWPAIACALPLRTTATLRVKCVPNSGALRLRTALEGDAFAAATAVLSRLLVDSHECELDTTSDVPPGAGLGSSSALCAAVARAAKDAWCPCFNRTLPPCDQEIFDAAMAGERVFHGRPSGIDAACSLFGGAVAAIPRNGKYIFESGIVATERHIFVRIPHCSVSLAVVNTNTTKDSTRGMVERVCNREALGAIGRRAECAVQSIVDAVCHALNSQTKTMPLSKTDALDLAAHIAPHVRECQKHLCAIGASTPAIDGLVAVLESQGLHTKLTGAGGGGCVVALSDRATSPAVPDTCTTVYAGMLQYE